MIGDIDPITATGTFLGQFDPEPDDRGDLGIGHAHSRHDFQRLRLTGYGHGWAEGYSTITAALDGVTAQVVLTVTPVLRSLVVTPADPTVPMGESEGFTATGTFADNSTENLTTDVTWASANTATATISNAAGSTGLASALAIGTSSVSADLRGRDQLDVLDSQPRGPDVDLGVSS